MREGLVFLARDMAWMCILDQGVPLVACHSLVGDLPVRVRCGQTGAVTFVQRFGGALNLDPRLHERSKTARLCDSRWTDGRGWVKRMYAPRNSQ